MSFVASGVWSPMHLRNTASVYLSLRPTQGVFSRFESISSTHKRACIAHHAPPDPTPVARCAPTPLVLRNADLKSSNLGAMTLQGPHHVVE
jgi:hypothetical protein